MVEIIPARTLKGQVAGLFSALDGGFETAAVAELALSYDGIAGDRHAGALRPSGAREPWYPRGTEMANERQLSILGSGDLQDIAKALAIPELPAQWIGGNIVIEGIGQFSLLPPRTLLMFDNGVTVRIDGDNGPCRYSGRAIAGHVADRSDIEFEFVKVAKYKRGLVGWVERAGTILPGEGVTVRIWEQWIYPPAQASLAL